MPSAAGAPPVTPFNRSRAPFLAEYVLTGLFGELRSTGVCQFHAESGTCRCTTAIQINNSPESQAFFERRLSGSAANMHISLKFGKSVSGRTVGAFKINIRWLFIKVTRFQGDGNSLSVVFLQRK
jgi:hypothetical protein